jgi:acetyl-CoA carboxylase beta subunit
MQEEFSTVQIQLTSFPRQHLLSRHNPLNKCPRCRECFSDENGDIKSQIEFHLRLKICVEAPTREKYILSEHAIKELENETPPRNPVDFWYSLARVAVPYVRNDPIASLKEMFSPCKPTHGWIPTSTD